MNIVESHIQFMQSYYEKYDLHSSTVAALGRTQEADDYWNGVVENLVGPKGTNASEVPLEHLAEILALIHPSFYFNRRNEEISQHDIDTLSEGEFRNLKGTECNHEDLVGAKCIFGQNIEADHLWPKSLGGPRHRKNFKSLCEQHNKMKGNSIVFFKHNHVPEWLSTVLFNLRTHKA